MMPFVQVFSYSVRRPNKLKAHTIQFSSNGGHEAYWPTRCHAIDHRYSECRLTGIDVRGQPARSASSQSGHVPAGFPASTACSGCRRPRPSLSTTCKPFECDFALTHSRNRPPKPTPQGSSGCHRCRLSSIFSPNAYRLFLLPIMSETSSDSVQFTEEFERGSDSVIQGWTKWSPVIEAAAQAVNESVVKPAASSNMHDIGTG